MTPPATSPAARTAAPPLRRPLAPRRVSGPARRVTRGAPTTGVPPRVLALVDHSLLDRLIRGRIWIGLIGFALMSIVAMQVGMLKLNRGIAADIQRAQTLSRENSLIGAQVSALEASERIRGLAAQHGMVPAPAGAVRYLSTTSSAHAAGAPGSFTNQGGRAGRP
ncbi:MAG: hypothetical protein ACR2ND_06870 [Solirubrobacteraceae bacterium]